MSLRNKSRSSCALCRCLDACVREERVDVKRSRELQGFLDAIRRGQEQVLGDLSMTLCDPFAINFLATSALKLVNHQLEREQMPRDNAVLHLLLRMLALGLSAWSLIETQEFAEPRLDPGLVTRFVPALMSLAVDDQVYYRYQLREEPGVNIIFSVKRWKTGFVPNK